MLLWLLIIDEVALVLHKQTGNTDFSSHVGIVLNDLLPLYSLLYAGPIDRGAHNSAA